MKITPTITEALFYRAYNSYILQRNDFKENFLMLRDVFHTNPESFKTLGKNNVLRIKQMQDDFNNDQYTFLCGDLSFNDIPEICEQGITNSRHKELCHLIMRGNELNPYIGGVPDFFNFEHPTQYGKIDIFIIRGNCAYIVEVKTSKIDHSIIGQLEKYFIGISLLLNQKYFDDIKMISICPGYDKSTIMGLQGIGAKILIIKTKPFKISAIPQNLIIY